MEHQKKQTIFSDDEVSRTAARAFGIPYLYPIQRLVIANILDAAGSGQKATKEDSPVEEAAFSRQVVLLPTGAGKSFCFLIPALLLDGPTLAVYPLLALMADQKRKLDQAGIACTYLAGSQDHAAREAEFRKLEEGKARIIIANPEVLQSEAIQTRLASCGIAHVAVDEAHCVCDWGDSFRPAYLSLGKILDRLAPKVVTAFTATASDPVLSRIKEILFGGEAHVVRGEADRPNISYRVINCLDKKKEALRLSLSCPKPMIIFCGTRYKAEDMAREIAALQGSGPGRRLVRFYHAGMEREEKKRIEADFFSSTNGILCATCAYGMGVDKKDIRTVVHLECPMTVEEYVQESGRAGRDGRKSTAILLWSPVDGRKFFPYGEDSREGKMLRYARAGSCRRQILLETLGAPAAACSGCDVCERGGGPAPFASDGMRALEFIRRNRRMYGREALSSRLIQEFNRADRKAFPMNVWEHSDIELILDGLEKEGLVRTCRFPWKGRITAGEVAKPLESW